jgi:transposase-like protein
VLPLSAAAAVPPSAAEHGRGDVFPCKALRKLKDWEQPEVINTDKAPTYTAAFAELKAEGSARRAPRTGRSTI